MNIIEIGEKIESGAYKLIQKRKGRSQLWSVFAEIEGENGEAVEGWLCCRGCKKILKYDGRRSSNLNKHKCFVEFCNNSPTKKLNHEEKSKAIEVLAEWVTEDCRPFSAVSGHGFLKVAKYFIKLGAHYGEAIDVEDLIPQPTTISRRVQILADEEKNKIKPEIQNMVAAGNASVTMDMWTDDYVKRNFLCATLHFRQETKLKNIILGIKSMDLQSSCGENIKNKLCALFEEFGVFDMEKIKFVTDRGSNVKKALRGETRLNCSNHLLSNVLDAAFEGCNEIAELLIACKRLVKFFKKGNHQQLLPTSLKNHCPTRWNSYLLLFKSIADNWTDISKVLNDKEENHRLLNINHDIIKALFKLCTDIDTISRKLQGCSSPTLCYVLPSILRLKMICQTNQHDMQVISNLKQKILQQIEEKWCPNLSIWHKAASFLFPPTNHHIEAVDLSNVKSFCKDEILNAAYEDAPATCDPASSSVVASEEVAFFSPNLLMTSTMPASETAMDEIEQYAREKIQFSENFDVIKWWDQNSSRYPNLSKVALNILTIPASSAASERAFSLAGNILNEKRNRLAPKTIDNILFLNSIFKLNK